MSIETSRSRERRKLTTRWITPPSLVSCPILGVISRRILFHRIFISRFAFTLFSGPAFTRYNNHEHSVWSEDRSGRGTFNKFRAVSQSLEGVERPSDAWAASFSDFSLPSCSSFCFSASCLALRSSCLSFSSLCFSRANCLCFSSSCARFSSASLTRRCSSSIALCLSSSNFMTASIRSLVFLARACVLLSTVCLKACLLASIMALRSSSSFFVLW